MMRRTRFDRVRVYETLRSAHLERAAVLPPSSIFYRTRRADFDSSLARDLDLIPASSLSMAAVLATSGVRVLEINEPLMLAGLRRTVLALVTARTAARLRRRPLTVVCYAIENRNPFAGGPSGPPRRRLSWVWRRWLSRIAGAGIDRLVFGTEAAQAIYADAVPGTAAAVATVILALPAPCWCGEPPAAREREKEPGLVLFLGALTPRKGFDRVLTAWPLLAGPAGAPDGKPPVRLRVVGKGALEPDAATLARVDSRVTVTIDPPRAEVHAQLRRAQVLVLLSQPTPGWREQVGLPIVEALAHGCAVVTTTETALAGWLAGHGHQVLPPDADGADIAAAIRRALTASRTPADIIAALPEVDGRLAADAWLFGNDLPVQDLRNGRSGSDTDDSAE